MGSSNEGKYESIPKLILQDVKSNTVRIYDVAGKRWNCALQCIGCAFYFCSLTIKDIVSYYNVQVGQPMFFTLVERSKFYLRVFGDDFFIHRLLTPYLVESHNFDQDFHLENTI